MSTEDSGIDEVNEVDVAGSTLLTAGVAEPAEVAADLSDRYLVDSETQWGQQGGRTMQLLRSHATVYVCYVLPGSRILVRVSTGGDGVYHKTARPKRQGAGKIR